MDEEAARPAMRTLLATIHRNARQFTRKLTFARELDAAAEATERESRPIQALTSAMEYAEEMDAYERVLGDALAGRGGCHGCRGSECTNACDDGSVKRPEVAGRRT